MIVHLLPYLRNEARSHSLRQSAVEDDLNLFQAQGNDGREVQIHLIVYLFQIDLAHYADGFPGIANHIAGAPDEKPNADEDADGPTDDELAYILHETFCSS